MNLELADHLVASSFGCTPQRDGQRSFGIRDIHVKVLTPHGFLGLPDRLRTHLVRLTETHEAVRVDTILGKLSCFDHYVDASKVGA